jgi:hypothetical protein
MLDHSVETRLLEAQGRIADVSYRRAPGVISRMPVQGRGAIGTNN